MFILALLITFAFGEQGLKEINSTNRLIALKSNITDGGFDVEKTFANCDEASCEQQQCSEAEPFFCISAPEWATPEERCSRFHNNNICWGICDVRSCKDFTKSDAKSLPPAAPAAGRWYSLNPSRAFNAPFSAGDYVNGACNGNWKDARFMRSPYITSSSNSIRAANVGEAVQRKACIYQHTFNTCKFQVGQAGLMALEFDYSITGDTWSNWFSFWLNSYSPSLSKWGNWVPEAEIDMLEEMNRVMAHNFAGFGHQVPFKQENLYQGHVTLWVSAQGAQATDCKAGLSTCPYTGDIAAQTWSSRTAQGIQNRQVWHFFAIDYWATWLQSTMTISNVRMFGSYYFQQQCPVAVAL